MKLLNKYFINVFEEFNEGDTLVATDLEIEQDPREFGLYTEAEYLIYNRGTIWEVIPSGNEVILVKQLNKEHVMSLDGDLKDLPTILMKDMTLEQKLEFVKELDEANKLDYSSAACINEHMLDKDYDEIVAKEEALDLLVKVFVENETNDALYFIKTLEQFKKYEPLFINKIEYIDFIQVVNADVAVREYLISNSDVYSKSIDWENFIEGHNENILAGC